MKESVTVIGTGIQGTALVDQLLKAGFAVTVHDQDRSATLKVQELGARVELDVVRAMHAATLILLVVDAGTAALQLLSRTEVREALEPSMLVVHMGSMSVDDTLRAAACVESAGSRFCELVLAGPIATIIDATCPLLFGGDRTQQERLEPLAASFGKLVAMGKVGDAAAFNIAALVHLYSVIHGFALGTAMIERSGLDMEFWRSAIREGIGGHPGQFLVDFLWPAHFEGRNYGLFGPAQVKNSCSKEEMAIVVERCAQLGLNASMPYAIRQAYDAATATNPSADWSSIYDEVAPTQSGLERPDHATDPSVSTATAEVKTPLPLDALGRANLTVREGMNRRVARVRPEATMLDVAELMAVTQASDLAVVDAAGNFVGVLSEGDLLRAVLPDFSEVASAQGTLNNAAQLFLDNAWKLRNQTVTRLILHNPLTLHPDDSLLKAAVIMAEKMIRRMPVVEDGKFVGSLSRADVAWISVWQNRPTKEAS